MSIARMKLEHVPAGRLILPKLYKKQHEAIYSPKRISVIEASTKAGKTVGCITWILDGWWTDPPGANSWWVAPVSSQSKIAFDRILNGLAVSHGVKVNRVPPFITAPGGGVLWFKSGDKPDSLYGDDVVRVVVDEASRMKSDSWTAIRSTLTATQGQARVIGNVRGRGNWHYKLARQAELGDPEMSYSKITAYDAADAGVFPHSEIESARRMLPEHVFRELYLAEPSDDGGNPFGIDAIARCVASSLSTDPVAAWGVDLAKSHDWTVLIGLDKDGRVAAFHRWQGPWRDTIRKIREIIGEADDVLIDSTGVGDPIVEELQQTHYNVEGFKFTAQSKQQLMEGLASAIQQEKIAFPDNEIRAELDSFEYLIKRTGTFYSAPDGIHDDCVCALALAFARLSTRSETKVAGVFKRAFS